MAGVGARPLSVRLTSLVLAVTAAVVVVDQLAKRWALAALADGPIPVLGPLRLNLTYNRAAAFGLGGNIVPLLAVMAAGIVVVAVARGAAEGRRGVAVSLGLLLGGALGNIVDRLVREPGLLRGAVVDFIDVGFWPVFNLADCAITLGCVALVVLSGRPARATPLTGEERS